MEVNNSNAEISGPVISTLKLSDKPGNGLSVDETGSLYSKSNNDCYLYKGYRTDEMTTIYPAIDLLRGGEALDVDFQLQYASCRTAVLELGALVDALLTSQDKSQGYEILLSLSNIYNDGGTSGALVDEPYGQLFIRCDQPTYAALALTAPSGATVNFSNQEMRYKELIFNIPVVTACLYRIKLTPRTSADVTYVQGYIEKIAQPARLLCNLNNSVSNVCILHAALMDIPVSYHLTSHAEINIQTCCESISFDSITNGYTFYVNASLSGMEERDLTLLFNQYPYSGGDLIRVHYLCGQDGVMRSVAQKTSAKLTLTNSSTAPIFGIVKFTWDSIQGAWIIGNEHTSAITVALQI